MPGVLIVEAMGQVAALMMLASPVYTGRVPLIGEIENARFYRPVVPGDTLITEATIVWARGRMGKVSMIGRVAGEVVAKCEIKFALTEEVPRTRAPHALSIPEVTNGADAVISDSGHQTSQPLSSVMDEVVPGGSHG